MKLIMTLKDLRQFLDEEIWRVTRSDLKNPLTYRWYTLLKVTILSIQQFMRDRIITKAEALTYNTLLSIVPLMAIFGFDALLESHLRQGFEGQTFAIEVLLELIDSYLQHARSGIFIGVGLVMLLWTVLTLTGNIERAFNQIWQVKTPRSLFRKITDYLYIFLLLPVFCSGLCGPDPHIWPDHLLFPLFLHVSACSLHILPLG